MRAGMINKEGLKSTTGSFEIVELIELLVKVNSENSDLELNKYRITDNNGGSIRL